MNCCTNFKMPDHSPHTVERVDMELQWETKLRKPFNVLTVGKIFRLSSNCLIVGGEDGMITVYEIPAENQKETAKISLKELIKLETKGGPVQTLCLHDVTKFGSVDLLVGDAKGMLTFFGNKQILYKMAISEGCISTVTTDIDAAQNLTIIVGDCEGNVFGCLPHCTQWRLRVNDMIQSLNKRLVQPMVTSVLSVKLPISSTLVSNYVIVADSNSNLYVLQNGTVIRSLEIPSVVNTMCVGYFLDSLESSTPLSPHSLASGKPLGPHQVALGMEDGRIFILNNFSLTLYANIKLSLTKIVSCSSLDVDKNTDVIFCCGYFNSVLVYHKGELLHKVATTDWVNSISVIPSDGKNEHIIYLGTLDGSIQSYKMKLLDG